MGMKPGDFAAFPIHYPTPAEGWTCFHCGTHFAGNFKGWQEALHHFGEDIRGDAWCQYTAQQVRSMEDQLLRYREEDTPRDRYLHKIQAEHTVALRRAEEEGYARGIRDATEQSAVEREAQNPCFANPGFVAAPDAKDGSAGET